MFVVFFLPICIIEFLRFVVAIFLDWPNFPADELTIFVVLMVIVIHSYLLGDVSFNLIKPLIDYVLVLDHKFFFLAH